MDVLLFSGASLDTRVLVSEHLRFAFSSSGIDQSFSVQRVVLQIIGGPNEFDLNTDAGYTATRLASFPLWSGMSKLFVHEIEIRRVDDLSFDAFRVRPGWSSECDKVSPGGEMEARENVCQARLVVWRLRYMFIDRTDPVWAERTVFEPGTYVVRLSGLSSWAALNAKSCKGDALNAKSCKGEWFKEITFDIVYPEQLRPYVVTTTIGDPRVFETASRQWDPTPRGLGFPLYQQLMGAVQLRVPYFKQIFPKLFVQIADEAAYLVSAETGTMHSGGSAYQVDDILTLKGGTFTTAAQLTVTNVDNAGAITGVSISGRGVYSEEPANPVSVIGGSGKDASFKIVFSLSTREEEVDVTNSPFGKEHLTDAAKKWRAAQGIGPRPVQELLIPPPWPKGALGRLMFLYTSELEGEDSAKVRLDEWAFEGSRYDLFLEHVARAQGCVDDAYDHNGSVPLPSCPDLTGTPDAVKVGDAKVSSVDWLLPYPLANEVVSIDEDLNLRFLRVAERLGCRLKENTDDQLEGYVGPAPQTLVSLLLDGHRRGYALWLRTKEPLDWRRVTANLLVRPIDQLKSKESLGFQLGIVPSPDASSAFLFAIASERPVRLPKGIYDVTLQYACVVDGLPTLRRRRRSADKEKENVQPFVTMLRIVVPFGNTWPK